MRTLTIYLERLIMGCGISGPAVPIIRHISLILIAAFLAWLSGYLCRRLLVPLVERLTRSTATQWDDRLLSRPVLLAACRIVPAIVIAYLLPMVFYQFPVVHEILARLTGIYITVNTVRLCLVFIEGLRQNMSGRRSSMQQYVLSFCGVLKIASVFIGGIIIIALALGKNPTTLFAGLGATSAILMLVFKDTIEGLVAGIRLTSNDMMHVGDWITVSAAGANGIVKEMSLTTVKVQNFDNTIVTVSPITLVNGSFQNWKGMQAGGGRRVQRKVYYDFRSIHFVDAEQKETNMSRYRQAVEDYLRSNPLVNADMTLMVRQLEATQCGLPLEIYFFLKDKTWVDYEHQLAAIMEHIYAMAPDYKLTIYQQYPEQ